MDNLDSYAVRCKLRRESRGPLLQKCFTAGICGEIRGGKETSKACHCEDESAPPSDHTRGDKLCNAQSGQTIDSDDVLHLLFGCIIEGHRYGVRLANIIDKDANVANLIDDFFEGGVIFVAVGCKVYGQVARFYVALLLNLLRKFEQLGLSAGDEKDVVAFGSELNRVFFSNAIACAGDDSPAALLSKGIELLRECISSVWVIQSVILLCSSA